MATGKQITISTAWSNQDHICCCFFLLMCHLTVIESVCLLFWRRSPFAGRPAGESEFNCSTHSIFLTLSKNTDSSQTLIFWNCIVNLYFIRNYLTDWTKCVGQVALRKHYFHMFRHISDQLSYLQWHRPTCDRYVRVHMSQKHHVTILTPWWTQWCINISLFWRVCAIAE